MLSNAILYNKLGTSFYKTAQRIQTSSQPILRELSVLVYNHPPLVPPDPSDPSVPSQTSIGDLEPLMETLQLLMSTQDIQNSTNLILDPDPLSSLFNFELPRIKPLPPPPSPLPPPPPKPKVLKKKRPLKVTEPIPLDASSGFRAPRTRRALAAVAAFEAEAGVEPEPEPELQSPAELEPGTTGAISEPPKKRRRPSTMPGQAESPPMVTDVDSQGLFKMFDAGWILPAGQRRGGRQPVERVPPLPKKKKTGKSLFYCVFLSIERCHEDRGTSKLSMFSTNASENQTLNDIPGPSGLSVEEKAEMDVGLKVTSGTSAVPPHMHVQTEADLGANEQMEVSMVLDTPEKYREEETETQLQAEPAPGLQVEPHEPRPEITGLDEEREDTQSELEARIAKIPIRPNTKINLENGKIVVEELDTPKIRREKARRRKAEKAAAAAAAAAAQGAPKVEVENIQDDESDLSSLSDLESERGDDGDDDKPVIQGEEATSKMTPEVQVAAARRVPRGPAALITTGPALVVLEPERRLEGGTLGALA